VAENRVGIASGVNNGVSRVAGLLAIAVLGAVISAHFGARLDAELNRPVSIGIESEALRKEERRQMSAAIAEAKEQPLGIPDTGGLYGSVRVPLEAAASDASTSAFHLGALLAGSLMILGGIASGIGIRNKRRPDPEPVEELDLAANA
jgi:hypothetical protein